MNHDQIKEKIYSFYDDELSPVEKNELEIHLKSCGECSGLLKQWEQTRQSFSKAAAPAASENFIASVMGRIEELEAPDERPERGWSLPDWLFPSLGYSVAVALIFVAVNVNQPSFASTTESVLLSDVPDSAQWAFSNETSQSAPLLDAEEEIL